MTIQYDNLDTSISAVGSASNIPIVFRAKGTSALDLSAGSSGINISNGNTVTAITRTAAGTNYTTNPSVVISAPQIAGGVQATATVPIWTSGAGITPVSGGTGYTLNDVVTVQGGTFTTAATYRVTGVSGGVVSSLSVIDNGAYSSAPSNPVSVTGGTGSGLTFNLAFVVASTFTITNAGSGYVEQPTVTFSGGGGSGATAYATVGSGTTIKSVGSTMSFATPFGEAFRVLEYFPSGSAANYIFAAGRSASNPPVFGSAGSDTNISLAVTSKGTGSIAFTTSNGGLNQFQVSHTASAVNYVQVTGAATTNRPTISTQGSDTNIGLLFAAKGTTGATVFLGSGGSTNQFVISNNGAGTNFLQTASAATANAPVLSAQGSDTNIDLALTPKGTGRVRFGTYTATVSTIAGYIEILDSGGTVRRLAVVS